VKAVLSVEMLQAESDEGAWRASAAVLTEALNASAWSARHPVDSEVSDTLMAARQMPDRLVMLAAWDGEPTGVLFAELSGQQTVGFIRWVAVHPAYRRRGIATGLVDALGRHPGLLRVEGMVDRDDPGASAFWATLGWSPVNQPPSRIRMGRSLTLRTAAP
jgi:GNAT superfamily N-acetyltransferase